MAFSVTVDQGIFFVPFCVVEWRQKSEEIDA